jgi:RND family efflux transporter MFP subunit
MSTPGILLGKTDQAPRRSRYRLIAIIAVLVLLVIAVAGIVLRMIHRAHLASETRAQAGLYVSVVKPDPGDTKDQISLPGTVQAFVDAPIYARTDGYLKSWFYDIGKRVKKGDLMAVIETPEVDQQLDQARASANTAKANLDLAIVTNKRYQVLVNTAAVSRQEADQAASNQAAQQAQLNAAMANVRHYEALQGFQNLYAPFDGIVTERNTDIGQLVSAGIGTGAGSGTGASGRELFRVATLDKLRTFIPVPQAEAPYIKPGQQADLSFVEHPARKFPGHVARTSNAIDSTSRTLLTEVDIDNKNGELFPGAYVTVHMDIPGTGTTGSVKVPANTLIFRAHGMQVAVVGQDNKVHLKPVDIGRDFGNEVELVNGVTKDDNVVVNPPDSLGDGQDVKIAKPPQAGATEAQGGQGPEKQKQSQNGETDSSQNKAGASSDQKKNTTKQASSSPGAAPEKQSAKPDEGDAAGDKTGNQTDSGMTAPGSDGNGKK